jgi:hypothetical protein
MMRSVRRAPELAPDRVRHQRSRERRFFAGLLAGAIHQLALDERRAQTQAKLSINGQRSQGRAAA